MNSFLQIPAAILLAIIIDWAIYDRTLNVFRIFFRFDVDCSYTSLLFPRILGLITGAVLIVTGIQDMENLSIFVVLGTGLIIVSNIYPFIYIYFYHKID